MTPRPERRQGSFRNAGPGDLLRELMHGLAAPVGRDLASALAACAGRRDRITVCATSGSSGRR